MNKLKLRLDDLRIDSFDTAPAPKEKGTVFGEQCTCYTQCTCPGSPTCDASCDASCNGSCDGFTCGDSCDWTCEGADTCFVSCQVSECWRGGACVVW